MWVAAGYQYKAIAHRATSLAPPLRDAPDVRGQAQQRRSPPAYLRPHTVAGPSRVRRFVERAGLLCAVPARALLQGLPWGAKGQSECKREPVCCTNSERHCANCLALAGYAEQSLHASAAHLRWAGVALLPTGLCQVAEQRLYE